MSVRPAAPYTPRVTPQATEQAARPASAQANTAEQLRQALSGPLTQRPQREAAAQQLLLHSGRLGDDDFYSLTLTLAQHAGGPQMDPEACAGLVTQAMDLHARGQITSERLDQFLSGLTQGMGGPEMPPQLSQAVVEAVARHVMQSLVVALALMFVLGVSLGSSEAAEPSVTAAKDAIQHEFAWAPQADQDELVASFQAGQRASLHDAADRTQLPQKDTKHTPPPGAGADLPQDDIEDVVLERDSAELRARLEHERAEAEKAEAEHLLRLGRRPALDELLDTGPEGPGQDA